MRLHAQHRHFSRARITIMNTANHRRNPVERDLTDPLRRQIGALLIRDAEWRRPHLAPQIDGDEYLSGTGTLAQERGTKHLLSRACHTTIQEVLSSSLPGNVHNAPHLPKLMGKMNAPRQTRASRPKVKTGCNNCKLRRIKCDETRPQCLKCVKAKKQCGGYPVFKRPADLALPPIAPAPPTRNVSDVSLFHPSRTGLSPKSPNRANLNKSHQCQSLTFSPQESVAFSPNPWDMQVNRGSFDQLEGQYFQVFRIHTASELSGFFDSDFWTRSVLVESHSEASVRHAVIALGALYKTLDNAAECRQKSMSSCSLSTRNHYNYALQQYGKSIKHLRESLAVEETRSPRTMLISIIIFTCIQSFTGDHGDAIAHIQTGLRLIEEWGPSSHEPELIQIFTRLTIQAKSYDMAFHLPNPIRLSPRNESVRPMGQISPKSTVSDIGSSVAGGSLHIPDRFHSAKEARPALDYITQSILRLMESLSSFHPGPNNILPRRVKNYCHEFGVQLDRWGLAFEPLVINARHDVNISDTEKAGIFVLKMFFNMTYVLFFMSFSTTEMDFDNFTPQFDEIVDVANEISIQQSFQSSPEQLPGPFPNLVNMIGNQDNYCKIKASFALELGIVPPLYVVATKCRIRRLRREAIRLLLSSPRREGMWDSLLCGHLAQWIMDIEEEDLPPWNGELDSVSSQYVPTYDKRVMVKGVFFNLQNHEATIRCGHRAKGDGDLDTRIRSTEICW